MNFNQILAPQGALGGFAGSMNQGDIDNLVKAIEATQITGRETTNVTDASGAPLKLESLASTLKNLSYRMENLTIWNSINKSQASNTVEEYAQRLNQGGADEGGFFAEGQLPESHDTTYTRRAQTIKAMGEVGEVTDMAQMVNTIGSSGLMAREVRSRTESLLRRVDRSILLADSAHSPAAWNGLYAQHEKSDNSTYDEGSEEAYLASPRVIDLRGAALDNKAIANGAKSIVESGSGQPSHCFFDFSTLEAYRQRYLPNFLTPGSVQNTDAGVGNNLMSQITAYGKIGFKGNIFMAPKGFLNPAVVGATSPKAPIAIVPDATTPVASVATNGAASKFSADDAGAYSYAIRPFNNYGFGPLTILGSATIAAGEVASLKFAYATGVNSATAFEIYRTKSGESGSGKYYPIFRLTATQVANSYNGATAGTVSDLNWYLPGTSQGFMLDGSVDTFDFRQLGSLYKFNIARTAPVDRFALMLYGTPIMANNKRFVRFINIGLDTVPTP